VAVPKTVIQRAAGPNHLILHYSPKGQSEITIINK